MHMQFTILGACILSSVQNREVSLLGIEDFFFTHHQYQLVPRLVSTVGRLSSLRRVHYSLNIHLY